MNETINLDEMEIEGVTVVIPYFNINEDTASALGNWLINKARDEGVCQFVINMYKVKQVEKRACDVMCRNLENNGIQLFFSKMKKAVRKQLQAYMKFEKVENAVFYVIRQIRNTSNQTPGQLKKSDLSSVMKKNEVNPESDLRTKEVSPEQLLKEINKLTKIVASIENQVKQQPHQVKQSEGSNDNLDNNQIVKILNEQNENIAELRLMLFYTNQALSTIAALIKK
jgi:hypothetical protein